MSMAIPTSAELTRRLATSLSQQTFIDADGQPVRLDATAPGTFEQILAVVHGLADYETYLFLQGRALEFLPSTATVGNGGLLPQHADIWGVPRIGPQAAVGRVVISAGQPVTIVQGATLTVDGSVQWALNEAVTVPAGGSASVGVTCTTTGTSGNLAANTSLSLVQTVAGVSAVVVDQDGLAGGSDMEAVESWRSRILERIRYPYGGGTAEDYRQWARNAGAQYVNVVPGYTGVGTVGIVVALTGAAAPTTAEIARVQSYIDSQKPVRANATVYPARLVAQQPVVHLGVDTQANRQAVQAAFSAIYAAVGLGGRLYLEGLQAALFDTVGAGSRVVAPTDDVQFAADEMPVMNSVQWSTP